jgi:enamine deaminase RidA (YjgF/YER057c/UK114 family)
MIDRRSVLMGAGASVLVPGCNINAKTFNTICIPTEEQFKKAMAAVVETLRPHLDDPENVIAVAQWVDDNIRVSHWESFWWFISRKDGQRFSEAEARKMLYGDAQNCWLC